MIYLLLRKRKVIVNLKTDRSFRGILWRCWFGVLVIRQAEMLAPKGETVHMDGELVIFKDDIEFIQVFD